MRAAPSRKPCSPLNACPDARKLSSDRTHARTCFDSHAASLGNTLTPPPPPPPTPPPPPPPPQNHRPPSRAFLTLSYPSDALARSSVFDFARVPWCLYFVPMFL